ncbi:hypothetical protein GCM10022393_26780 [Aquimarina addita]|uniref:YHYH domain-containing protein n=1 Tax=Aquimarina addita TaxID=870485 RepID=A0ABP6ULM2_9FLAO
MKKLLFYLLVLIFLSNAFAHNGGHGKPTVIWKFVNSNKTITADFIKKEGETVFLRNEDHKISTFNYNTFAQESQQYILDRTHWVNNKNKLQNAQSTLYSDTSIWLILLGITLLLFSIFIIKKKIKLLTFSLLGMVLVILGCKNANTTKVSLMAANNISFLESVFGVFDKISTRYDDQYFYIESDGIPAHEMMTGITNWQQQVPINHDYTGNNAWAIPIQPEVSENPLSTKDNFMKGAIAIAANGIPIFNPLNNRGEDANAIGELDKWGGHCGRADDYHYHLAPTHLQSKVGPDKPIAYALDGFPVYGETNQQLDENLGRFTSDSTYQYHTIKEYPYLIAAMKGKVKINPETVAPENEIMPQAKTKGVRPDLKPLRDAEIVNFTNPELHQYSLTYRIDSLKYIINYGWDNSGKYNYEFVNPDGTITKAEYKRK